MNFDDFRDEALESVLDDLRELARPRPDLASALIRLLRAMRDWAETVKDTCPPTA